MTDERLQDRVPFAVVGSNCIMDVGGTKKRCRKYPWGIVEGKTEVMIWLDFPATDFLERQKILRENKKRSQWHVLLQQRTVTGVYFLRKFI